jgi:hypothetical protein
MSRKTRSSFAVVGRLVPAAVGAAALVTFVVGFGTGVATIVKWLNTPTAADAINAVSPWGGLALVFFIAYGYATADPPDPDVGRIAPAVALLVCGVLLFVTSGLDSFRVFGVFAIAALPFSGALIYAAHRQALFKPCPECAEAVRREARVCRFCGWRFAPRSDMTP